MKHALSELTPELHRLACDVGVELMPAQEAQLLDHLGWLLETNRTHNLTAVAEPHAALRLHVVDSVTALPEVLAAPSGRMLDIGTGGGFPGFPLAVLSGRSAVLLDSVQKKARLLEDYLASTAVEAVASGSRAEALAEQEPGVYAVVVARAVAQLGSLLELAAPLLQMGGRLVALKGQPSDEEREIGRRVARLCGMREHSAREVLLPDGSERRLIIVFEKVARPQIQLPRRVGLAQKQPLS